MAIGHDKGTLPAASLHEPHAHPYKGSAPLPTQSQEPLTRQKKQEEVGSSHGYAAKRAGLLSDSWGRRRSKLHPRPPDPGLQSPSPLSQIQPAEGGTQNRSLACAGSESLGWWGDTLGRHLLPLMVLQVFRVQVQPGSRADVDKRTDPTLTPLTGGTFLILH